MEAPASGGQGARTATAIGSLLATLLSTQSVGQTLLPPLRSFHHHHHQYRHQNTAALAQRTDCAAAAALPGCWSMTHAREIRVVLATRRTRAYVAHGGGARLLTAGTSLSCLRACLPGAQEAPLESNLNWRARRATPGATLSN